MFLLQTNQWMDKYFVRNHLPIVQPFDVYNAKSVVVIDNASIHHIDSVVAHVNSVGALVRFLPPYSPDFNPIESIFGEVKQYLQSNDLHTSLSMNSILLMAFYSVSQENCKSYIKHAGYV